MRRPATTRDVVGLASRVTERQVPPPGSHGGDAAAIAGALGVAADSLIDLSASLNPFAPDTAAVVGRHVDAVHSYPDASLATHRLAEAIGIDADRLVLTNGGSEAIALVAAVEPDGRIDRPDFSLYERHLDRVDDNAPRWRSNPHNPSGRLADADEVAAVWDEAFYPLATGAWTRGDDTAWRLGSLTKVWACPGLRLGYVIAPDGRRADAVRRRQPAWAVNGLALAVIDELLDATDLPGWSARISAHRARFVADLRAGGLVVDDTDANWVLVHDVPLRTLLAPHGVVVRDCTSFGLPTITRIALPCPADLDRVLTAVDSALADWQPP